MARRKKTGMSALPEEALLQAEAAAKRARQVDAAVDTFVLAASNRLTLRFERYVGEEARRRLGVEHVVARVRPLWPFASDGDPHFVCVVMASYRVVPVVRVLDVAKVFDAYLGAPDVPGDLLSGAHDRDDFEPLDLTEPITRAEGWSAIVEAAALANRFRIPIRFSYVKGDGASRLPAAERHVEGVTLDGDRLRAVDRDHLLKNAKYRDARKRSIRAFVFSRIDSVVAGDVESPALIPLWDSTDRSYVLAPF